MLSLIWPNLRSDSTQGSKVIRVYRAGQWECGVRGMFRHTYPQLDPISTEWVCLTWPMLAGFESVHLNALKSG